MEHLSYKEWLRGLEKRRLQSDPVVAFQSIKGSTRKLERDFFQGHIEIRQGGMRVDLDRYKEGSIFCEHGLALPQVA